MALNIYTEFDKAIDYALYGCFEYAFEVFIVVRLNSSILCPEEKETCNENIVQLLRFIVKFLPHLTKNIIRNVDKKFSVFDHSLPDHIQSILNETVIDKPIEFMAERPERLKNLMEFKNGPNIKRFPRSISTKPNNLVRKAAEGLTVQIPEKIADAEDCYERTPMHLRVSHGRPILEFESVFLTSDPVPKRFTDQSLKIESHIEDSETGPCKSDVVFEEDPDAYLKSIRRLQRKRLMSRKRILGPGYY